MPIFQPKGERTGTDIRFQEPRRARTPSFERFAQGSCWMPNFGDSSVPRETIARCGMAAKRNRLQNYLPRHSGLSAKAASMNGFGLCWLSGAGALLTVPLDKLPQILACFGDVFP